ncbi:RagB/SusD family nutrient uptake outer membrane protein [Flavisolibacter tropicus]|uniref:Membrane protein n=1 Tax=Flavisolibacter tropicus TaxID=1492898 RepID=A0A172TUS9_9BACT|nr:RagB/SusD family nutrient uptake outer membrane protein [Flavisolibacter tropicus]ANE50728.1 membrane protein [Flavisolibacter tropicus]
MKTLIIKTSFVCLTALALTSGCKKFLDQEVVGAYPEQDFYKTDEDATQATTAVYDMMQAHYNTAWTSLYMVKTLLTDESNAGGNNSGDQPQYQALDDYNFDATNAGVRDVWRILYFTIYRANKVINSVKPETDLRKRLIAESKALRAYNYLELVSLWGDVPLVLADIPKGGFTTTKRAPKAEIYAQIEKDLNEAIAVLPLKSQYSAADKFRVSKGTAQAILGKALLYEGKWSDAATQFEAVITSAQYGLAPTIGSVFSKAGEFGIESLMEVSYTSGRNYDWGNFPWGAQPESNIHVQLMGPRGDFYTKAPADSLIAGWGFILPKKKMYDAFTAAGDANRRKATVMSEDELKAAGGKWTGAGIWDYEGYFQRKYGSFETQTGGPINELNYGTNWRLIRYADVLLMAAEAYNKAGNDGKALPYINMVRQRPGTALPALTGVAGTALFDAIVKERQLELAFEGVRFQDLVRWGKAAQELGPLGFKTGKHELLPIPDYDVKSGGLSQNNNY